MNKEVDLSEYKRCESLLPLYKILFGIQEGSMIGKFFYKDTYFNISSNGESIEVKIIRSPKIKKKCREAGMHEITKREDDIKYLKAESDKLVSLMQNGDTSDNTLTTLSQYCGVIANHKKRIVESKSKPVCIREKSRIIRLNFSSSVENVDFISPKPDKKEFLYVLKIIDEQPIIQLVSKVYGEIEENIRLSTFANIIVDSYSGEVYGYISSTFHNLLTKTPISYQCNSIGYNRVLHKGILYFYEDNTLVLYNIQTGERMIDTVQLWGHLSGPRPTYLLFSDKNNVYSVDISEQKLYDITYESRKGFEYKYILDITNINKNSTIKYHNNTLYIFNYPSNQNYSIDIKTQKITSYPKLNFTRKNPLVCFIDNNMYVLGGFTIMGLYVESIECLYDNSSQFKVVSSMDINIGRQILDITYQQFKKIKNNYTLK